MPSASTITSKLTRALSVLAASALPAMAQVSHVQVFVDSRDLGGVQLGQADATPLAGASSATLQSQITGNRFRALVDLPQNEFGLHSVFVYARSASTGREGIATTGVNIISNR